MADQYIFIVDVARKTGRSPGTVHAHAKKAGFAVTRRRNVSGQTALAVSVADAKWLIENDTPQGDVVKLEDVL
jgi:hypothetical protein